MTTTRAEHQFTRPTNHPTTGVLGHRCTNGRCRLVWWGDRHQPTSACKGT